VEAGADPERVGADPDRVGEGALSIYENII